MKKTFFEIYAKHHLYQKQYHLVEGFNTLSKARREIKRLQSFFGCNVYKIVKVTKEDIR